MRDEHSEDTTGLRLTDPEARRRLAQVYRLLLKLGSETEAPAESAKTGAGADGDRLDVDRQVHDPSGGDQGQKITAGPSLQQGKHRTLYKITVQRCRSYAIDVDRSQALW
jgi:hypothetical protein